MIIAPIYSFIRDGLQPGGIAIFPLFYVLPLQQKILINYLVIIRESSHGEGRVNA